ncbi:MAG TPA: VWA domain-containing protein [Fibrobacteria bacterium]|jgi:Ca-activated chloride channel family protein|nr:VWA domain-containing protein [Fibrobacteria bacterium]
MTGFGDARLLWLLGLAPLLALFLAWARWRATARLRRFADPELLPRLTAGVSPARRLLKAALLLLGVFFLALAIARPLWGSRMELVQRKGVDVVVAVDVSLSMLAEDIRPNRLARSKQEIQRFAEKLEGDRIGLVAFAGDAFLQCPLTSDYGAFRVFLDVLEPGLVDAPGTDLGRALEEALKAFPPGEGRHRAIVLLTDGEDHGGHAMEVAEEARKRGVVVHVVGIGSPGGVPIPIGGGSGGSGNRVYKRDAQGQVVSTRLDTELLANIARTTGGELHLAQPGRFELLDVLKKINAMEKRSFDAEQVARLEERFQFPLAAAIVLLTLEFLVSDRRRRRDAWRGRFS